MKRIGCLLLVSSLLLATTMAHSATRPRYGGTLHVAMQAAPVSLDPNQPGVTASHNLTALVFDTLVALDAQGRLEPALATSWQAEPGDQRWRFTLRTGVSFGDNTPMTADSVASSLRAGNPSWRIVAERDAVVIERDTPSPDLPAELALSRNSIVKQTGAAVLGTGPFVISQWDAGKRLVLVARDDYWGGRPFVGTVEITMGVSVRDQAIAFDLDRTQLIEVAPEQARRMAGEGRHIAASAPADLVALVFGRPPQNSEETKLREALSLSIDRSLLNAVVLQNGGEPTAALLPDWITGYGFLFPTDVNLTRAQQERAEVPQALLWNVDFDRNDPVARVLAERILLSARDAGLRMQVSNGPTAEVKLVRLPLTSLDAHVALAGLASAMNLTAPTFRGDSVDDLFAAETTLLRSQRVIPLLHLRRAFAVSNTVRGWSEGPDGGWHLADVWLTAERQ